MATLLYRGQAYAQHKEAVAPKRCVELTYRREHYNTCRDEAKRDLHPQMKYRGVAYIK